MKNYYNKFRYWYYRTFFNFKMGGFDGTMMPQTGKGDYVSVYMKGKIIQIVQEKRDMELSGKYKNEIRIIPCQYNHGVMVESINPDGTIHWRNHLSIEQLNKGLIYASNVEQLAGRK